jgi:hypothetical protein
MIAHGLVRWAKAELANAWTYVVKPRPIAARQETLLTAPPSASDQSPAEPSSIQAGAEHPSAVSTR